jgi:hypothetical protein
MLSDAIAASSELYESAASVQINQCDIDETGFDAFLSESASIGSLTAPSSTWPRTEEPTLQLPSSFFEPYVRLFVDRLYPIFPVLDAQYLLSLVRGDEASAPSTTKAEYALLSSLAAATIVQLNVEESPTIPGVNLCGDESGLRSSSRRTQTPSSGEFFASQCRQARREYDFIEELDESTILTSFFLFAYYGNLDQSRSAWYYLHEAIGFAQSLGLDSPETYHDLSAEIQQRRCRLFWLLFISERFDATPSSCCIDVP